jgi:tetratricopeptide (TPR) repeat protein
MLTAVLTWNVFVYWYADVKFAEGKQYAAAGQLQLALANLDKAVQLNQNEAYFWDELGILYGSAAQALGEAGDASGAAQVAQLAIQTGNKTIELNPVHPNYYKSLTRIYLNLALFNPEYLKDAEATLQTGTEMAPTDPKLRYNLALIREGLGEDDQALADFEQTVAMKPNYEDARMTLADRYEKRGMFVEARAQYHYILDFIQPANEKAQKKLKELPTVDKLATPSAILKTATSATKNIKK